MYFLTFEEVLAKYQREDKPFNSDTTDVLLAPLAGTSWDRYISEQLSLGYEPISASSLYHYIVAPDPNPPECHDRRILDHVGQALEALSLSKYAFSQKYIHTQDYLERDELLLFEKRLDYVYVEAEHTAEAKEFEHTTEQYRFYKNGQYLQGIGVDVFFSGVGRRWRTNHCIRILSEGVIESRFLVDKNYRLLPYIRPDLQMCIDTVRHIYVNPDFSFETFR